MSRDSVNSKNNDNHFNVVRSADSQPFMSNDINQQHGNLILSIDSGEKAQTKSETNNEEASTAKDEVSHKNMKVRLVELTERSYFPRNPDDYNYSNEVCIMEQEMHSYSSFAINNKISLDKRCTNKKIFKAKPQSFNSNYRNTNAPTIINKQAVLKKDSNISNKVKYIENKKFDLCHYQTLSPSSNSSENVPKIKGNYEFKSSINPFNGSCEPLTSSNHYPLYKIPNNNNYAQNGCILSNHSFALENRDLNYFYINSSSFTRIGCTLQSNGLVAIPSNFGYWNFSLHCSVNHLPVDRDGLASKLTSNEFSSQTLSRLHKWRSSTFAKR